LLAHVFRAWDYPRHDVAARGCSRYLSLRRGARWNWFAGALAPRPCLHGPPFGSSVVCVSDGLNVCFWERVNSL
jgi:hypothetical protein